jgi:hypothetical protein
MDIARARLRRLLTLSPLVGQTALAAGAAWFLATDALGHSRPFMAPVAAIVALGLTYGQRVRRSLEIAAGVAVGVLIADLILVALGGGAGTIALVVGLAMAVAILLGGRPMVVSQAATSATVVAAISPHGHLTFHRFTEALVGGAVALLINLVLFPVDPVRIARRASTPLLDELAAVLRDIAKALEDRNHPAAEDAFVRARGLDALSARFAEATTAGGETALWSPLRRRDRDRHARFADATEQLTLAVGNVRVIARGALRALDLDARVPPDAIDGLRELAAAARTLAPALDDDDRAARARAHVLRAAGQATIALEQTQNLSASVIVGQVRSTATDLLRGLGVADAQAAREVRAAAARAAEDALRATPR